MRFFEWESASVYTPDDQLWILDLPVTYEIGGVWLGECKKVSKWNEEFIATYPPTKFMDVDFPAGFHPVFSTPFREYLDSLLPNVVQYLPIRLQRPDGTGEVRGYSIGQILECRDCIDRRRTEVAGGIWKLSHNGSYNIPYPDRVCLRRDAIDDAMLFRVHGYLGKLVIREDLKNRVEQEGFTGCLFLDIPVSG